MERTQRSEGVPSAGRRFPIPSRARHHGRSVTHGCASSIAHRVFSPNRTVFRREDLRFTTFSSPVSVFTKSDLQEFAKQTLKMPFV
jgi:hypothetical protein